jgi:membrane protein insertase Oxa1/YidC/SpoIIIJ
MTGYRQSGFDPNAYEQPGKPLRPYNMVQWAGVAAGLAGIAIDLAYFADKFGWIDAPALSPSLAFPFLIIGFALINSRREPATLVGSEQLEKNRKVLLVTLAILVLVLGLAALIDSLGAL